MLLMTRADLRVLLDIPQDRPAPRISSVEAEEIWRETLFPSAGKVQSEQALAAGTRQRPHWQEGVRGRMHRCGTDEA